jgi:Big-like domain-containing protein
MSTRFLLRTLVVLCAAFALAPAANAETGKKALILDSSVSGGAASVEAQEATSLGFAVTMATDVQWGAMTAAQFADYQLLIVGDPTCVLLPQVVSSNAAALANAVMAVGGVGGNTKAGNRILIGTDPVWHFNFTKPEARKIIHDGIDFAGAQEGATGLYLDFTCSDPDYDANGTGDGVQKLLPLLTIDPTPNWTENSIVPCGGSVSLISNAAQFATLHSSDLQGWFCSDHETFPTFPTDWSPLAIATDTTSHPTCGTDVDTHAAVCGESYILIAGSGVTTTSPNLSLTPPTATNPVGTTHTVTATVTAAAGGPASGVHVTFLVTGANAGASGTCNPPSCDTDATGHVTFTYTGTNAGDDTIHASITVGGSTQSATAAKTWTTGGGVTCLLTATLTGPPKQIQITVQASAGLASIVVLDSANANTVVPPFTVGTTSPVVVTSTKLVQTAGSHVALRVTDTTGASLACDPVVPAAKGSAHGLIVTKLVAATRFLQMIVVGRL